MDPVVLVVAGKGLIGPAIVHNVQRLRGNPQSRELSGSEMVSGQCEAVEGCR